MVELAAEPAVLGVELEEGVAGRESHLIELGGVPSGDDDAAARRVGAEEVDGLGDLVYGCAGGVGPATPLGAVDGAEVAVGVSPLVPDGDAILVEVADVGIAAKEPKELVDDGAPMELFGGDEGEGFAEVEAGLSAEKGEGAGSRSVSARGAVLEHEAEELVISFHGRGMVGREYRLWQEVREDWTFVFGRGGVEGAGTEWR